MKFSTSHLAFLLLMGFTIVYPAKFFLFKTLHIYLAVSISFLILTTSTNLHIMRVRKTFFLAGGIYLIPILSILTTSYPQETRADLLASSVNIGAALLASYSYRNGLMRKISLVACSFAIVMFLASMILLAVYGSLRPKGAAIGAFSNHVAAIALLALPYLFWARKHKLVNSIYVRAAIISCFVIVILSLSRTAAVVLVVVLVLMQAALSRRISNAALKAALICVGVSFLAYASYLIWGESSYIAQLISRFQQSQLIGTDFSTPDKGLKDYSRAAMYFEGIRMMQEYWPLGSGLGGLKPYMEDRLGFGTTSHNIVITAVGELGIIGAIGYPMVFSAISIRLWRLKRASSQAVSDLARTSFVTVAVFLLLSLTRPISAMYIFPILMGLVLQLTERYTVNGGIDDSRHISRPVYDSKIFND